MLTNHAIGQAAALLCAVAWAFALVLFRQSGRHVPPLALNLFKNTVGLILLAVSVAVLLALKGQHPATLFQHAPGDFALLILSGVIGLAVADTIFFRALNLIGVGFVVIVDCVYTPFVTVCAWLLLGERLLWTHYIGAALVLGSVVLIAGHKPPPDRTPRQILAGILLAVLAMACMAFAITFIKPTLERFETFWATTIRLAGGNLFLAIYALFGVRWRENWRVFSDRTGWRYAIPGAVLGTYVSLVLWIAGFKYTHASVAAVLNQTSVIFATVLSAIMLKERLGGRKITSLAIALVGVMCVTLAPQLAAWATETLRRLTLAA